MKSYLVTWANHVSPGEGNLKMQMIITSEELVNVNELYCPVLADRFYQIDDRGDAVQKNRISRLGAQVITRGKQMIG